MIEKPNLPGGTSTLVRSHQVSASVRQVADIFDRSAFIRVVASSSVGVQNETRVTSADPAADGVLAGVFAVVLVGGTFVDVHARVGDHFVAGREVG